MGMHIDKYVLWGINRWDEQYMLREIARCEDIFIYTYLTKKNFGLLHVYFLYTVFRAKYRALISKVTCLLYVAS